ncbi:uncharacterized protein RB166_006787 isoform 2-T2 [Leptodactylus fuscus]
MQDAFYGRKYGKYFYSCLQDYILCPLRKEPLIGLQYIVQLYPEVDSEDAFECTLCKMIGPLYFIMKHIESYKHRMNYLSITYKQLLPLFSKQKSYYERTLAVREHAIKVEQQEKTFSVKDSKSCASQIGVKSDFWEYNLRRQEKLEKYKEKHSAYETQKKNILQYMETLVITSPEEAALVQNLTEELEAALNVYSLKVKPKCEKYYKSGHGRSPEGEHSRHSDLSCSKQRSIWYEKKIKSLSSSACKGEVQSTSDEYSVTEQDSTRKRSRSASEDMLLKVTFSTGSENKANTANIEQDQQRLPGADPVKDQSAESNDKRSWTSQTMNHNLNASSDLIQKIQAKRFRKQSTDVAKWESLFANNRPETRRSIFSWSPKSSSLDTSEASPSNEISQTRRASLDALATFTLFSQEGHEYASASSQPHSDIFSSLRKPDFKQSDVPQNRGLQHERKQMENTDQELPCTSNTVCNEVWTIDNINTGPKQQCDDYNLIPQVTKVNLNSEAETSCDQLSDVNLNVAQAPELSHICDASSEYFDLKAYGNGNVDTKNDSHDADSSHLDDTLTSGMLHVSGRQLSPEVLQLFKGKDTTSIVNILKTLSPFYPALQELDLEVFAKGLSKNGAITE